MALTKDIVDEINVLLLFDISNHQEGIKVHQSAGETAVEAVGRLYDKKLVTQKDGGYLTDLGLEAAENVQALYTILTTD